MEEFKYPREEGEQKFRLLTNCSSIAPNARAIAYEVTVNFIDEYKTINASLGGMRPAKLLVYLSIVLATVQKSMRDPLFEKLGDERFDDGDCGVISRRAIAESTGIPRENVRRIVKELIDEGRIIETTDGHVRQPSGYMEAPGVVEAVNSLVNGMVKTMQHLINMDVVQIR